MKRLLKNIKRHSKVFTLGLLLLGKGPLWAKTVGIVTEIKGHGFASFQGRTQELRPGFEIQDFMEVMTEEGAQIKISDYFDHHFYLAGSGHIKFINRILEIKRGYLWLQSHNTSDEFTLQTANALSRYRRGEGIISFDPDQSKTQVLSITGEFSLANVLAADQTVHLRAGEFSFVAKDYAEGRPRLPTTVGEQSFRLVSALFEGVRPMSRGSLPQDWQEDPAAGAPARGIASMPAAVGLNDPSVNPYLPQGQGPVPAGATAPTPVLRLPKKVGRVPSSLSPQQWLSREKAKLQRRRLQRNPRVYQQKSGVPVQVFGLTTPSSTPPPTPSAEVSKSSAAPTPKAPQSSTRVPASLPTPSQSSGYQGEFEQSQVQQYKLQMRHSQETNQLIQELKSYQNDYSKDY